MDLKISRNYFKVGKKENLIRKWITYFYDNVRRQEKKPFSDLLQLKMYYLLSDLTYTDLPIKY